MQITISDSAKSKLSTLAAARHGDGTVRIGLRSGGCKGFEQFIEFSSKEMPGDHVIDIGSLKVFVDKKSAIFLSGATLDWKTSLTDSMFVFIFPEKKPECSCGKSFSL